MIRSLVYFGQVDKRYLGEFYAWSVEDIFIFLALAYCNCIMQIYYAKKYASKNIMHKSIMQMYYCKSIIISSLFRTCC